MTSESVTSAERWFTAGLPDLRGAGTVLVLSRDDVVRCLDHLDAVEVVRRTLADHDQGRCVLPAEAYLRWDNSAGAYTRSIAMPGAVRREGLPAVYGLKIINASITNPAAGLERAGGVGLCFDPETARITAIVEVGLVSAVRTAAVSAVAVEVTGHAGAPSLTVLGCGTQGGTHASLFLARMPAVRRVALYDPVAAAAEQLAGRLRAQHPDLDIRTYDAARPAAAAGAVVVATTTADDGYLTPDWLAPGALVVNVSLADLTGEAFLAAGALYVDDVDLVAENPRRPLGRLMHEGRVVAPGQPPDGARPIDATLGALVTGRSAAVPNARPYTVVNPFGMGILDVALLDEIRRIAVRDGHGTAVRLG